MTEGATPKIHGKDAIHDPMEEGDIMAGVFSDYRCPVCEARLSVSEICLNACHLSRFQQQMMAAMFKALVGGTAAKEVNDG